MLADLITIFLSCFGFTQQLLLFKKQRSTGSFSIFLTAVIIIASILKINFWFISPFKTAIFVQMFILITLHLLITKEYVKINGDGVDKKKGFIKNFWQWESFNKYLLFLAGFSLVLASITYISIMQQYLFMGQAYGYLATCCEISLAFPQIFKIWRNKTAKGVSKKMIAIWLCSDVYKTIYFISNAQPLQFIATGCIQTVTDLVLSIQMWFYRKNSGQESKQL